MRSGRETGSKRFLSLKNRTPAYVFLVLSLSLLSWGRTGHRIIGNSTALFIPPEMEQFSHWPALLAYHGMDADYRKNEDPAEGPKHYIDIDNYPEFRSTGRIPLTLDSVYMLHHPNFVEEQGTLPWVAEATYDSLVSCFVRRDWDRAVLVAADLGHYIGDAHMPLHLTRNYNGQFTGNDGIHYRYESEMLGDYSAEIGFEGDSIGRIEDVNVYIFDIIYRNYPYVDSILAADDYATQLAGNTWSAEYSSALWEKTRSFTIPLLRDAAFSLTQLIYTAWAEAGKPLMNTSDDGGRAGEKLNTSRKGIYLAQNHPNPFRGTTILSFNLQEMMDVSLYITDNSGRIVERLLDACCPAGETRLQWDSDGLAPGYYYLVLKTRQGSQVRKMMLLGD